MQLLQYGFVFVMINQGVARLNEFIRCFRERRTDSRWQNWEVRVKLVSVYITFNCVSHCSQIYTWTDNSNVSWHNSDFMYPSSLYIISGIEIILRRILNVHYAKHRRNIRFTLFYVVLCYVISEDSLSHKSYKILAFLGFAAVFSQPRNCQK